MGTKMERPVWRTPVSVSLVLILLLGLDLRVRAALETEVIMPLRADAGQYFAYAYNLRYHGVYSRDAEGLEAPNREPLPDALRSPGYPLFLVPFLSRPITAKNLLDVTLVQALLGALLILIAYFLSRPFLPAWAALGVALLTALSPHLINAGVYILTETLFSVLLGGVFVVLARAVHNARQQGLWLAVGMLTAAATLTRPTLQYFIVPLLLLIAVTRLIPRRRTAALVAALGFALVMMPWLVRNWLTLGTLGDNRLTVNTLQHGMYPDFEYRDEPQTYGIPYRFDPLTKKIEGNLDATLQEIYRRFSEEPARHLQWFLIGKPVMLWSWNIVAGMGDTFVYPVSKSPYFNDGVFRFTRNLIAWLHLLLVILALIGSLLPWIPAVAE